VRGRRAALVAFVTIATTSSSRASTTTNAKRIDGDMSKEVRRREDGVVIQHDPYAPGMMEQYGMPGATDDEGFDPYKDTVGPGIYGGIVKRDVVSSKGQRLLLRDIATHRELVRPQRAQAAPEEVDAARAAELELRRGGLPHANLGPDKFVEFFLKADSSDALCTSTRERS